MKKRWIKVDDKEEQSEFGDQVRVFRENMRGFGEKDAYGCPTWGS